MEKTYGNMPLELSRQEIIEFFESLPQSYATRQKQAPGKLFWMNLANNVKT